MLKLDTGTDELLCEIEDRVATITLNKPHKKNALGDVLTPALRTIIAELEDNDAVGCLMITGAGDAFCAGGDVSGMGTGASNDSSPPRSDQERIAELIEKQKTLTKRIHESKKITLAALPGAAAGAGLSIALACDLRVASDNAFITTAFAKIGLSGDYGASWFLPRLIGLAKAKELFYLSDRIGAEECARLGIVNKVFPQESFREEAKRYAQEIAHGPSNTLSRMKINLHRGMDQDLDASLGLEAEHLVASRKDPEAKEAIAAFMEKRDPKFHT